MRGVRRIARRAGAIPRRPPKASRLDPRLGGDGQVGGDLVEHGLQLGAHQADGRDDDDGDESGDQAILDRGRAGLVLDELGDELGRVTSSV